MENSYIFSTSMCFSKYEKTHYYNPKLIAPQWNTVPATNLKYLSTALMTKNLLHGFLTKSFLLHTSFPTSFLVSFF